MKIQALSASLPVLDWRVLHAAGGRIPSVDPVGVGRNAFLKGFGRSGTRSMVRIPWRPAETVFFEAKRGVQLSPYLPSHNAATRVLRRVYIGGPQVRFDLALFAPTRTDRLRSVRYRKAARSWWSSNVRVRHGETWLPVPLKEAAYRLGTRFFFETRVAGSSQVPDNLLSILPPQLIIIGFIPRLDVPPSAMLIMTKPSVWLLCDSTTIRHQPQPELIFMLIEDKPEHIGLEQFSEIRRARRELNWLHADLQFLLEAGRAVARDPACASPPLLQVVGEVAEGLSRRDHDEASGFAPLLLSAWCEARANQLSLWRKQIGTSLSSRIPFPAWLTHELAHRVKDRQRKYYQTLADRLEYSRNTYPEDGALQLGEVALVEQRLLSEHPPTELYLKEQRSAFATYFGLPETERLKVSVVIPVRGGVFPIAMCLESIGDQVLFQERPKDVEVVIIEDGPENPERPLLRDPEFLEILQKSGLEHCTRRFVLHVNRGRTTARNVGIFKANGQIVLFVDSWMVLDQHHLAEHAIRHHRSSNLALLGFKENIILRELTIEGFRSALSGCNSTPDPRLDWKWQHKIVADELDMEGVFRFRHHVYEEGDTINYMSLTNFLRGLPANERIGPRTLPTFFQTNVASVRTHSLRAVGGFPSQAFKDNLWSMEDSYLGALLVASGVGLVPCPSALAFKIEHAEPPLKREYDLKRHRQLYAELLLERWASRAHEAEDEIRRLEKDGFLEEATGD